MNHQAPVRAITWRLPQVIALETGTVQFAEVRIFYEGRYRKEVGQAIGIQLRTDQPFAARALSPVLYIGNQVVQEYDLLPDNVYRFLVISGEERLREGAPIKIGWSGLPQTARETGFHYRRRPPVIG